MTSHPPTPGSTTKLSARSVLVLAPHADDEVLGCGGLMAQLARRGAETQVLFLSDSAGSTRSSAANLAEGGTTAHDQRQETRDRRRRESDAAVDVLGLGGAERLDLPDGALDQHLDTLADGLRRVLELRRPELVLVPSPLERSADHRAAFAALHRLLSRVRNGHPLANWLAGAEILAYEINQPLYPDLLVDVSEELEILERAMACYSTQQAQHDYWRARLGLLRYRTLTLPPEVEAAEAYRRLTGEDFRTRGPAELVAHLGAAPQWVAIDQGPRISVVVRTKDRPAFLAEALASLARSTWTRAEVVVVNDGGAPPELPDDYPLDLRRVDLPENRGRAAAANAGVEASAGDYIAFLDDDDLVEPEHLATLAGAVQAAGVRVAYTDAAVGVYTLDGKGWHLTERRLPYSRDFDPELLLVDNYIPFNTLLLERTLFAEAGAFDPELPFFEDWDFLVRLAALTPFHHIAQVTCEYRQFRGAGHHILGDLPRQRDDFLVMKARVMERHARRRTPLALAQTVDRLRAETVVEQEESSRLRREIVDLRDALAESRDAYSRLNGKLVGLETHVQVLEATSHETRSALEIERREHQRLDGEVERLYGCERELRDKLSDQSLAYQESSLEKKHTIAELRREADELRREVERHRGHAAELEKISAAEKERRQAVETHVAELETHAAELDATLRREIAAHEERHAEAASLAEDALRAAHAAHGATDAKLRAMVDQERETSAELGRTYQEIERLNALVRRMESTRAWRLHQWIQSRKG